MLIDFFKSEYPVVVQVPFYMCFSISSLRGMDKLKYVKVKPIAKTKFLQKKHNEIKHKEYGMPSL